VIRFFFAQAHYRSPPDFSEKGLKNAEKGLNRIHRLKEKLERFSKGVSVEIGDTSLNGEDKIYYDAIQSFKECFEKAMDDDFNTPEATAILFDFVNKSNSYFEKNSNPKSEVCKYAYDILVKLGNILTLFQTKTILSDLKEDYLFNKLQGLLFKYKENIESKSIEELLDKILIVRGNARKTKDWKTADDIRKELEDIGFEIQDTNEGTVWRKK
jgi:cysteinyl-tRNA synthetase